MGSPQTICCSTCGIIVTLGKWDWDLAEAIVRGSSEVKKQYRYYCEKYLKPRYDSAKEFAEAHTDKGHKVQRVRMT
jgi:hypothetical protein